LFIIIKKILMEENKSVSAKGRVLVTGITGFIGMHVGKLLLEKGYTVRGTVRDKKNEKKMAPLKSLPHFESLELAEADLLKPESWDEAVKGCDYVMHVASPFPIRAPRDEQELIRPAVQGTTSVLKACFKHHVKHVVVTSSIASVMSGGASYKPEYTEADWADTNTIPAYNKSKTFAERAAWNYYHSLDPKERFKLTTILPGLVFGPAFVTTDFSSGDLIRQLMTGELPALPRMHCGMVDVRDVAAAHVAALDCPTSDGQRYMCCADDHLWMTDISDLLVKEFGKYGYRISTRRLGYCCFKIIGLCERQVATIMPFWERRRYSRLKRRPKSWESTS